MMLASQPTRNVLTESGTAQAIRCITLDLEEPDGLRRTDFIEPTDPATDSVECSVDRWRFH
ncbi:MAG: hypothetical protein U0892_09005 [Pirellulales bacterium]